MAGTITVAILCQEEPVFLAPFIIKVIKKNPNRIKAVFLAGKRSGGEKSSTLRDKIVSYRIYWHIMEPIDFIKALILRMRFSLLKRYDPRSIKRTAYKYKIPVYMIKDPNSKDFYNLLHSLNPDTILNQSELILPEELLTIPKFGFINRHASLLPKYRGRLASFRSHAAQAPEYGTTIHFIDSGIDTGGIIDQYRGDGVNSIWPYPKVLTKLCNDASEGFWASIDKLNNKNFKAHKQNPKYEKVYKFPTLDEAKEYRKTLKERRKRFKDMQSGSG